MVLTIDTVQVPLLRNRAKLYSRGKSTGFCNPVCNSAHLIRAIEAAVGKSLEFHGISQNDRRIAEHQHSPSNPPATDGRFRSVGRARRGIAGTECRFLQQECGTARSRSAFETAKILREPCPCVVAVTAARAFSPRGHLRCQRWKLANIQFDDVLGVLENVNGVAVGK